MCSWIWQTIRTVVLNKNSPNIAYKKSVRFCCKMLAGYAILKMVSLAVATEEVGIMIRLIASDIDGTLLPYKEKALPEELFTEIARLSQKGILFCPASGRQYNSLRKLFAPVANHIPYVCENGAVVFGPGNPGPLLGKTAMDRRLAVELCRNILALPEAEVLISGADTSYLCPKREGVVEEIRDGLGNRTVVLDRPEDMPEDIIKVSVYCPGRLEETRLALVFRWERAFHAAVAGAGWLDFTLADKGIGLGQLCTSLGVGVEEVMAFGDNYNDLPMLEKVGRPYLVASAAPELRERVPGSCRSVLDVLREL